jgi:carbon starvation protein CstA
MTNINKLVWLGVIVAYYLIATVLPIDKLIAKIYPFFGASLLIMGFGIGAGLIFKGYQIPEISFSNFHPKGTPIFPFLFITIACGAISGFHATQSPMMARCLKNEKEGRRVFYGSMIAEGIIALIWAAAAMTFFGGTEGLLNAGSPGVVVNTISNSILGKIGGVLALFWVVACPITSGDTAFRSARLSIADAANINQTKALSRFMIAIPLFAIGVVLCFMDFTIIWRYFTWSNQTLATIALWTGAAYLSVHNKTHWIATIPATFMTCVIVSYILMAPEGFRFSSGILYSIGILSATAAFIIFMLSQRKKSPQLKTNEL